MVRAGGGGGVGGGPPPPPPPRPSCARRASSTQLHNIRLFVCPGFAATHQGFARKLPK